MSSVTVGKKWDKGAVYIGRGSPFGNPWPIDESDPEFTRDAVCDRYESYFEHKMKTDPKFKAAVHGLVSQATITGSVTLGCYCAPKRCHGETIKRYIESKIK